MSPSEVAALLIGIGLGGVIVSTFALRHVQRIKAVYADAEAMMRTHWRRAFDDLQAEFGRLSGTYEGIVHPGSRANVLHGSDPVIIENKGTVPFRFTVTPMPDAVGSPLPPAPGTH